MWLRNRLVNPLVRLLLRSPLHPLLSRSLVILSYQGRKSGRWRSLPCMYARDGQDLYIIPAQPDRKVWWRNLRQPTPVRLRRQGRELNGTATASSDPEAVAAGLRRYLAATPRRPGPAGCGWMPTAPLTVRPGPPTRWTWSPSTWTATSNWLRRLRRLRPMVLSAGGPTTLIAPCWLDDARSSRDRRRCRR